MDFLLHVFETAKNDYAMDPFLGPCCNAGWKKLDKYYSMTDRTSAYTAALVLCPQWKWSYFQLEWKANWVAEARVKVEELWINKYKALTVSAEITEVEGEDIQKPLSNEFLTWRTQKRGIDVIQDEYTQYLQAPLVKTDDARAWWTEPTQRATFPNLSVMALDLLSIPSMSAAPERLFSGAKITISDRRNRLGIVAIQAVECLKSWFKKNRSTALPFVDDELSAVTDTLLQEAAMTTISS
jgi:hypothetical protein